MGTFSWPRTPTGGNAPSMPYSAGAYRVWAVAMSRRKARVGDVIQVTLPTNRYAYGRVLRDASVAFYSGTTAEPGIPPIGSHDYQFVVGVYDDVPGSEGAPVVGHDPARGPEDDWPPPNSVRDPISGAMRIYH